MRDPELDRNLDETKELSSRWSQFHDFFNMALKGGKATPEAEMKFLDLKTRIAMLHDGFMQALTHDHKVGQNVLQILGQCIMLRRIPHLGNAEVQKLEFDWNEAYLLMTETVANLEEEQSRLDNISEKAYKMKQAQQKMNAAVHNFFVGPWFKLIVVVGVLGFVLVGVPMLGIFDYMQLKIRYPWTAPVYDRATYVIRLVYPDLRYVNILDIKTTEVKNDEYFPDDGGLNNITPDYVFGQLPNMGFDANDVTGEVKTLWERGPAKDVRMHFGKEKRMIARGRSTLPLIAYYLLFEDSADAKHFVDLRRRGLAKLDKEKQSNFDKTVNVARKANFVGVFVSPEDKLRLDFAKAKWGFTEKQMNQ